MVGNFSLTLKLSWDFWLPKMHEFFFSMLKYVANILIHNVSRFSMEVAPSHQRYFQIFHVISLSKTERLECISADETDN